MVEKVHGSALPSAELTGEMNFYTLTTAVDIRTEAAGNAASQARLDKTVEIISLNGQPVILGAPSGSGPYELKFVIEHANAWETPEALVNALVTHGVNEGFDANSTTVVIGSTL